jgi:PAS domain S-box-containing protein
MVTKEFHVSELIDNRAHRLRTLKEIILKLHAGEPAESVREDLARIVRETDYSDIVAMEQELMAEGMPVEEVQCMCDLHSQVTREVLVPTPPRVVPHGHPANTLRRENDALRVAILRMREAMAAVKSLADDADGGQHLYDWRLALNQLMDIDKHYARKENLFFTCLEKYGVTGPSKVMWAKDDEVRNKLKTLSAALHQTGVTAGEWKLVAATVAADAIAAVEEMFYKEESILLPICFEHFTEDDWATIWASSPRYGWCIVEPLDEYRPPERIVKDAVPLRHSDAVQLPTGNLTLEQLRALFETLPVDLTYVDADDRVAFFSEGPDRIFSRSKAIVGRKVQHCHPPKSVDTVDRILADFREGRQNVAEFWINFHGRFVHIRYFAVRDAGNYLGCLEVTQDLTKLRALEGERRLLQYDEVTQ